MGYNRLHHKGCIFKNNQLEKEFMLIGRRANRVVSCLGHPVYFAEFSLFHLRDNSLRELQVGG